MNATRLLPWTGIALGSIVVAYLVTCIVWDLTEADVAFSDIPVDPFTAPLPANFLWGTATAAHQIEGGNVWNDWARFEAQAGNIKNDERSGQAADHWNRVAEDVGLMQSLGANAYRFSLEWSRLEPSEGMLNEAAWEHYADEVAQLRNAGIVPMVTLLHFTLPAWLAERGGVTASDFPARFGRFAAEAARRLGANVELWCTLNEPNVQMYQGYVEGIWPPGVRDPALAAQAFAGLLRGHAAAAAALRREDLDAVVGIAMNLIVFDPASKWSIPDRIAAREADKGFNWAFYDSVRRGRIVFDLAGFPKIDEALPELTGSVDYFGANYYRRNIVRFTPGAPGLVTLLTGPGPLTDTGIEIYPEGLLRLLRRAWRRYRLPIYVTENGIADSAGTLRPAFLRAHAHAVNQAMLEGISLRGYFHWSLMDNFEWSEGFGPRFGLYSVDYETFERTETPGVHEFRRLASTVRQ